MCEREEAKTGERTCIDEWKSSAALCSYCAKAYFLDSSGPVEMVGVVMLTFLTGGGVGRFSICHSVGPRDGQKSLKSLFV